MKSWNALLQLIGLLILSIVGVFVFISIPKVDSPDSSEMQERSMHGWCGTLALPYPNLGNSETISPLIGKELFKENCATCHAKNMVSSAIGPPLAESWKNFNKDTLQYFQYLTNREEYHTTYDNKHILKLHEDYGFIQKPNFAALTMDEVKSLILYIHYISP